MTNFDNIPYVFEIARICEGKCDDTKFSINYDEYSRYSDIFDRVNSDIQNKIIKMANDRKKGITRY